MGQFLACMGLFFSSLSDGQKEGLHCGIRG